MDDSPAVNPPVIGRHVDAVCRLDEIPHNLAYGMPASWDEMLFLGRDPLNGERVLR